MGYVPIWRQRDSLADRQSERYATPKHKIVPSILTKAERRQAKKDKDDAFRDDIWKRDGGKSRATGKRLVRGGTLDWDQLGEVDHVINRSTAPELIYERSNGILLSKRENRLKKTPCPEAPEHHLFEVVGPDDRALPQIFIWRGVDGKVIRKTGPR